MKEIDQIIFITLDCCRFDTTQLADIPFMRSLGEIRRAQSYGTYTLPSHISCFVGYLPNVIEEPLAEYYSRTVLQLWRLKTARVKDPKYIAIPLEGDNIFEGYKKKGYFCLGTGGVRWFRSKLLTQYFDKFFYWGCDDYNDVFAQREKNDFSLLHTDEIICELKKYDKWFLFINSQETHVPYDVGDGIAVELKQILKKANPLWGGKMKNTDEKYLLNNELKLLHNMQIKALEEVDKRIKYLVNSFSGTKLIVICGDHGEAFGENDMYGHGFPNKVVTDVPLLISIVDGKLN
jgi:hypothetical protein